MPTKPATKKPAAKKPAPKKPVARKAPARKHVAHSDEMVEKAVHHAPKPHAAHTPSLAHEVARSHEQFKAAVGRRKSAIARVRFYKLGTGEVQVNSQTPEQYFGFRPWADEARAPLTATGWQQGRWSVKTHGGGKHSQAQAMRHGIARLLTLLDPAFRPTLKPLGFLTRDARVKERKKYGLKRARRAPQWQKR